MQFRLLPRRRKPKKKGAADTYCSGFAHKNEVAAWGRKIGGCGEGKDCRNSVGRVIS